MSGWRRIALPASIVLNLFLIALIGGHLFQARRIATNAETPLVRALARAEATLPPRDATAFAAAMRRDAPRFAAAQKQLTQARQELQRQIAAEQFNQADVRQALEAWQSAWNHFFDDFSTPLIDALSQVSPEGRRKLVAARQAERP